MNKRFYRLMSIVVAFALTIGSHYSVQASSSSVAQMSRSLIAVAAIDAVTIKNINLDGTYIDVDASQIASIETTVIAGNTYYISTSGNDANPGTQDLPWKTISKVNNEMANFKSEDSVLFKRGDTWTLNSGGEAGSLIITSNGLTLGAYGEGDLPLLDGTNMEDTNGMWRGMVVFENVSNVTLENLYLYNAIKQNIGIGSSGTSASYITIQNCIIRKNQTNGYMLMYIENSGALVDNITIRNNIIYDSKWNGMRITGGVTNVFIYGNIIYDVIHNGIDTYPSNSNNNSNFQIYDNNIYNFGTGASGAGIYIPGTNNVEVYENNLHDSQGTNDTYGVKVGRTNGFVNENVVVRNNRIWNVNSPNSNTYGLWFDYCTNCSALNNTVYANTSTILNEFNTNLLIKNNLAFANVRDQNSMKNYTQDPQFVNATAGDFHLQPDSPACIAGENDTYIGAYACDNVTPIENPMVDSIVRTGTNPSSATSVDFVVTFSEFVTGVDASDFALMTTGVSGATISGVSGLDATYTVTVNTGSANGTIRLDVGDDDTIVDASGNSLNGGYTSGETYTITKEFTLTIVSANGSVAKNPDQTTYHEGDVVQLTATPNAGWSFANWSGDFTSSVNPGSITIHGNNSVIANYTQFLTLNSKSTAANDGWVLESSETSNTGGTLNATTSTFNLGDDKANKQYRGILHFDTSTLPDTAVITSVTLKIRKQGLVGTDPFTTHGGLLVDIQKPYFGTTAGLVIGDFQATPGQSTVATFDAMPVSNWYGAVMNSAGYPYVNLSGTTQFRLRFTSDDNNDLDADYMKFYSGDATKANRPQLIIQYYIP